MLLMPELIRKEFNKIEAELAIKKRAKLSKRIGKMVAVVAASAGLMVGVPKSEPVEVPILALAVVAGSTGALLYDELTRENDFMKIKNNYLNTFSSIDNIDPARSEMSNDFNYKYSSASIPNRLFHYGVNAMPLATSLNVGLLANGLLYPPSVESSANQISSTTISGIGSAVFIGALIPGRNNLIQQEELFFTDLVNHIYETEVLVD